jgi:predicted DNA-binding transcriptional regulator
VTAKFLQQVEAAVRSGLSVSAIERKFGFNNRAVRRAKAELYQAGLIPKPVGYQPKERHEIDTR